MFNREARQRFLEFAVEAASIWSGNFRDLNAAVVRMCTLAAGGRIDIEQVNHEITRLRASWLPTERDSNVPDLQGVCDGEVVAGMDPFDRVQLVETIRVCRACRTLSEAGRKLFAVSRTRKGTANDADRLRKYLARFGLSWDRLQTIDNSSK